MGINSWSGYANYPGFNEIVPSVTSNLLFSITETSVDIGSSITAFTYAGRKDGSFAAQTVNLTTLLSSGRVNGTTITLTKASGVQPNLSFKDERWLSEPETGNITTHNGADFTEYTWLSSSQDTLTFTYNSSTQKWTLSDPTPAPSGGGGGSGGGGASETLVFSSSWNNNVALTSGVDSYTYGGNEGLRFLTGFDATGRSSGNVITLSKTSSDTPNIMIMNLNSQSTTANQIQLWEGVGSYTWNSSSPNTLTFTYNGSNWVLTQP